MLNSWLTKKLSLSSGTKRVLGLFVVALIGLVVPLLVVLLTAHYLVFEQPAPQLYSNAPVPALIVALGLAVAAIVLAALALGIGVIFRSLRWYELLALLAILPPWIVP